MKKRLHIYLFASLFVLINITSCGLLEEEFDAAFDFSGAFMTLDGEMEIELHRYAKELLDAGRVANAWQVLLASDAF